MKSKTFYFILNLALFFISSIAAIWYLGGGVLVTFDDFSHFFNDFFRYFEYFSFRVLIPGLVSLFFVSFFGFNILKFVRDSDYLRKKKFKILLPITGIIITILGVLFLIIYGFILSKLEPTNTEIGIGVVFGIISLSLGGLILTIIFGIIGFFVDKAIYRNNISSILHFLKVLMFLFVIIIIVSIIIIAFNFFNRGCLSSDNKCLLEKAISEKNPEICSKNYWCYMKYYETQDSTVCSSMPDRVDTLGGGVIYYNFRDKCYEYFAYKEDNVALCDLIQRKETRDHCNKERKEEIIPKKSEADLSSPQSAYLFCVDAFKRGDQDDLGDCLSGETLMRFNKEGRERYIELWQMSFSACGGYDRQIVKVLTYPECYNFDDDFRYCLNGNEAYIVLDPVSGCQDESRMIKEDGEWKFNET